MTDGLYVLPGGTTRSEKAPRYDLVPRAGVRRIADRFSLGAEKHGEGNWKKSLVTEAGAFAFCREAYNHMMNHAQLMAECEETTEDHIGAIGWAVTVIAYAEELYGKPWMYFDRNAVSEPVGT